MAQNRDKLQAVMNTVMDFRIAWNFLTGRGTVINSLTRSLLQQLVR